MEACTNSPRISAGMKRKRRMDETIKNNDQTWGALDLATLSKIFHLLPSHELFWNVSLVCRVWQLGCWDKLFWNNDGCMDLTVAAPLHCCREDDECTPRRNPTCSDLMMHLLQTILFGTHDAYGNSLQEWRSSIKTIRIPFGLHIRDDFLWSLSHPELVVAERAAKPSRPLYLLGVVYKWNLKRLLLESPLFRKPIFTHFVDVDDEKVFQYILRSTFKSSYVDWKALYRSQPPAVRERCCSISQHLKDMVEKLTKCGFLPEILTEAEYRRLYDDPRTLSKTSSFFHLDGQSLTLAYQRDSLRKVHEFWSITEDLFSDDKITISTTWRTCRGKSVFIDHCIMLRLAERCGSELAPLVLKRIAEQEWKCYLAREGVTKRKVLPKDWAETTNMRKKMLSYSKYQEIAKDRREFIKKLFKIHTPTLERVCHLTENEQWSVAYVRSLKKSLKLLELWGGGPYNYINLWMRFI